MKKENFSALVFKVAMIFRNVYFYKNLFRYLKCWDFYFKLFKDKDEELQDATYGHWQKGFKQATAGDIVVLQV